MQNSRHECDLTLILDQIAPVHNISCLHHHPSPLLHDSETISNPNYHPLTQKATLNNASPQPSLPKPHPTRRPSRHRQRHPPTRPSIHDPPTNLPSLSTPNPPSQTPNSAPVPRLAPNQHSSRAGQEDVEAGGRRGWTAQDMSGVRPGAEFGGGEG